jgi:hypothetical protein
VPRYSLKRLFASTTLIAVGLACVIVAYRSLIEEKQIDRLSIVLWIGGGVMIGAGALIPFRMTLFGVAIGFVVQLLLLSVGTNKF